LREKGVTYYNKYAVTLDNHTLLLTQGSGHEEKVTADKILIADNYIDLSGQVEGQEEGDNGENENGDTTNEPEPQEEQDVDVDFTRDSSVNVSKYTVPKRNKVIYYILLYICTLFLLIIIF